MHFSLAAPRKITRISYPVVRYPGNGTPDPSQAIRQESQLHKRRKQIHGPRCRRHPVPVPMPRTPAKARQPHLNVSALDPAPRCAQELLGHGLQLSHKRPRNATKK